ncbi:MAG: CotH kinase family protein [Bacteroidota bacterium]
MKHIYLRSLILLFAFLLNGNGAKSQIFTSSNLPIIIISTNNVPIPDEPKIPGTMKIIDNGPGQINHITDPGNVYDGHIGIEIRGSYSATLPQKPYAIETRDSAQNSLDVSLFGFPEENDWVLLANYNDKVFMRNVLAFKLFNETGHYASRTRFAEVTVNGIYQGIYVFGEKIKRDNGRVDIAKLDPDENSGEPLTGGYIFKIDYWDDYTSWKSPYHPLDHPDFDVHYVYYYPKPEDISDAQHEYIKNYVTSFESALYNPFVHDSSAGYYSYMNVSSFIDYFIVNEVARNNDGFKKSFYFYKDRDGKDKRINCGPVWDFDWAWKNINECAIFANTDGSGWAYKVNECYPDVNSPAWHFRLLQDSLFANELQCRWELFRNNILNTDSLMNWVDANATYLWQAQQRHYTRWPILGQNVGTPVIGPIPTTFQGEIDDFKNWIRLRLNWLDANMPGRCFNILHNELLQSKPQLMAFPNPASDKVFVELAESDNKAVLQLYTPAGSSIKVPFTFDGNLFTVDVHGLAAGMYYARIFSKNSVTGNIKLIIAR